MQSRLYVAPQRSPSTSARRKERCHLYHRRDTKEYLRTRIEMRIKHTHYHPQNNHTFKQSNTQTGFQNLYNHKNHLNQRSIFKFSNYLILKLFSSIFKFSNYLIFKFCILKVVPLRALSPAAVLVLCPQTNGSKPTVLQNPFQPFKTYIWR